MALTPTFRTVKTLLSVQRHLEVMTNISPTNDAATTLNTKYGISPELGFTANGGPKILYFGVGINGLYNVDDGMLSEPNEVRATNMDLYTPLPIRCVPFEQDLSAVERANYRMRQVQTIGGDQYVLYYLKKITMLDAAVQFTQTNADGVEEAYVIDYNNLTPTPPAPVVQGVINGDATTVNVSDSAQLLLLGSEIQEAINVMYGGDMRYAKISEIGLYMGEDQTVSAVDYAATPFTYTEAIFAQLAIHRTTNGTDLSAPEASMDFTYRFTSESLVLSA